MKRYIEISELPNFEVKCSDGKEYVLLPFKHLFDIPTADVAEVKHGYWKEYYTCGAYRYDCSNCNERFMMKERCKTLPKYCSDCGAKMDGGNAE